MRRIVFLLYDETESLDTVGPYDVFSMANVVSGATPPFELLTVGEQAGEVACLGGLKIVCQQSIKDVTLRSTDALFVPGGPANVMDTFPIKYPETVKWLRNQKPSLLASVCSGAIILAHAGILVKGLRATTHHGALAELEKLAPDATIVPGARYVDNRPHANVVMSAGVSSGIDLAFHLLRDLEGEALTKRTLDIMEYNPTVNFAP